MDLEVLVLLDLFIRGAVMETNQIFTVKSRAKTNFGLVMLFMVVVAVVIESLFVARVPSLLFILVGVFFYVTSISTAILSSESLTVKPILGRAREFKFADGTFSTKDQTGMLAMVTYAKPDAKMLLFTKTGGKPVMVLNGLYDNEDIVAIYEAINKEQSAS